MGIRFSTRVLFYILHFRAHDFARKAYLITFPYSVLLITGIFVLKPAGFCPGSPRAGGRD
jgi:hypothetical protein